jgi:hypothetical protein
MRLRGFHIAKYNAVHFLIVKVSPMFDSELFSTPLGHLSLLALCILQNE